MVVALALTISSQNYSELNLLYQRVSKLPGVEIRAEMTRPSSVPMTFRLAKGQKFWAKYPTSEQFQTAKKLVTWMPDRREYALSTPEPGNPSPAGFEPLWDTSGWMTQVGSAKRTQFDGKSAIAIPCKAAAGHKVTLFISNGMPVGTIAEAGGTTYQMVYRQVKTGKIADSLLTFSPPKDARLAGANTKPKELLGKGTKFPNFTALSLSGSKVALAQLLNGRKGVIINFWFSACTGCIQEIPALNNLYPELKKKGIALIGINTVDEPENARKTVRTRKMQFPTLYGASVKKATVGSNVEAYPATFILDPNGIIIDSFIGADEPRLHRAISALTSGSR